MKKLILVAAVLLAWTIPAAAQIIAWENDRTTGANWRTHAAGDVDHDQKYGTDGYLLYGWNIAVAASYTNYDSRTANPQNLWVAPSYITDVAVSSFNCCLEAGGAPTNYGLMQRPEATQAFEPAPVLQNTVGSGLGVTIVRATPQKFRLTLILANREPGSPPASSHQIDVFFETTGSPHATSYYGDLAEAGVSYQSFDIPAGSENLRVHIWNDSVTGERAHLTGLAFDTPVYQVLTTSSPWLGGTISGGGWYKSGARVTLTATATNGFQFVNWTVGNQGVSTETTYAFVANQNEEVVAHFLQLGAGIGVHPDDHSTGPFWRTDAASDIDGDKQYGTDGYYLVQQQDLPFYLESIESHVCFTMYGMQFQDPVTRWFQNYDSEYCQDTLSLKISRATDQPFRLTLIFGAYRADDEQILILEAGDEGQVQTTYTGLNVGSVGYKSFDIAAGTNAIQIVVDNHRDVAYLTGLAFDHREPTPAQYQVRVEVSPVGGGMVTGDGRYVSGASATLTAKAALGYRFVNWTEDGIELSRSATYSFVVSTNREPRANFLAQLTDVTRPGDPIHASSDHSPANQGVREAIDNNINTMYLNFDKLDTGFTITPSVGLTVVTGLGLTSADDLPGRDPASYQLEGSDDGAVFTRIASGTILPYFSRLEQQNLFFSNSTAYRMYRLIFPTVANPESDGMQIGEVQLFGHVVQLVPPQLAMAYGQSTLTLSWDPAETGCTLETTTSLAPPVQWTEVPGVVGNRIEIGVSSGVGYYRLCRWSP